MAVLTHMLQVRVTDAQLATIKARAHAAGLALSEYVRLRALGDDLGPKPKLTVIPAPVPAPLPQVKPAAQIERVFANFRKGNK